MRLGYLLDGQQCMMQCDSEMLVLQFCAVSNNCLVQQILAMGEGFPPLRVTFSMSNNRFDSNGRGCIST